MHVDMAPKRLPPEGPGIYVKHRALATQQLQSSFLSFKGGKKHNGEVLGSV